MRFAATFPSLSLELAASAREPGKPITSYANVC